MSKMEAADYFAKGMESLKNGDTGAALDYLEQAVNLEKNALYSSYLAICLAKEKRDFKRALTLCKEALRNDSKNPVQFLNLGRIHLMAGQKKDAIRIFNMGLRYGENRDIINELKKFGNRRAPVIPFLDRDNPLNKYLGKLLSRVGLR